MSGSKADTAPLAGRDGDEALVHFILNQLDKDSAEDIVSIDLQGKSAMADHMVIASGRSTRQVSAMTEKLTDDQKSAILAQVPAGRMGEVDEIAASVLYLASAEAGYVTGATLHINGGMAML